MSYSNMSGLDLFQTPFHRSQSAKPQASGQSANGQKPNFADLQSKTAAASAEQRQKPAESLAQHKRPETSAVPPDQTTTASRADLPSKQPVSEPKAPSLQPGTATPKEKAVSAQPEETAHEEADKVPEQHQDVAQELPKSNVPADTSKQTAPQKELVLDMSTGDTASNPLTEDNQEKRKAEWEALEAKQRAEWEQKQQAREQKEEAAIQKLQDMSDDEVVAASIGRVKTDVERITRRNMKECVAEHIQALCQRDARFARLTMHPRKSMVNCFKYINRMAKEYVKQEMEDNDIKPSSDGYGCDVPDGLCYQWSENYFYDTDAVEDQVKEEKFVPKPYTGAASKPKKSASKSKKSDKPAKKESKEKQETAENGYEQMTLEV